jgi:hypothetical protein
MVDYIFSVLDSKTDLASIGSLLDVVLRAIFGFSFVGPLFTLFKTHINKRLLATVNKAVYRELEPFLRKLNSSLLPRVARTSLITP